MKVSSRQFSGQAPFPLAGSPYLVQLRLQALCTDAGGVLDVVVGVCSRDKWQKGMEWMQGAVSSLLGKLTRARRRTASAERA